MTVRSDSPVLDEIAETGLQEPDFYRHSNGLIYTTALELHHEGIEPDAIALRARLEHKGRLDKAGGPDRIRELAMLAVTLPNANAAHWGRLIVETSRRRALGHIGLRIRQMAEENGKPSAELWENARALVEQTVHTDQQTNVKLVTLDEFTAVTDDQAEPLIGTADETLLPADGMLLMYGDGGAGKTTLSIDALAHAASGTEWLGHHIPQPVKCTLIENEGPRGPFRRRLRHKHQKWKGKQFTDNVHVLEEPWTQFTLTDPAYRRGLAKEITRTQTQLVIVGPLASLGAKGTGTPDDVNEFSALINDLRNRTDQPFALWIVHHENKAGDVSGAWERVPDTLVHVTAQGNGRTRVAWRKVRWSSTLHGTSSNLLWAENTGYAIELASERDLPSEIEAWLEENPRSTTNEVVAGVKAAPKTIAKTLNDNPLFTFEAGPRNSKLWSTTNSHGQLDSDWFSDTENQSKPVAPVGPGSTGFDCVPPLRDAVEKPVTTPPTPNGKNRSEPLPSDDWVTDDPDEPFSDDFGTMHE